MGVVHKLKEDVINFILEQKKNNPSVSCRQLVNLVNQQFKTNISKSSINKIIQNANLSSAIGRRPSPGAAANSKKFYIPIEKKEQLSNAFQTVSGIQKNNEMSKQDELKESLPVCAGAGLILLKAAEWETGARAPLIKLIKQSAQNSSIVLPGSWETVLETLLFLKMTGGKAPEDVEQVQHIQYAISSLIEYGYEQREAFYEVKGFKLYLNDGTQVLLDAAMTSFWSQDIPDYFSQPLQKALSFLSKYLISNTHSLILKSAPENLADIVDCFENVQGKSLKKITVLNQVNQEIASFAEIPQRKRNFIAGVWPWQKEFKEEYKDTLRTVKVEPQEAGGPSLVILTNETSLSVEEITAMYTRRWPGWREYQEKGKKEILSSPEYMQANGLSTTDEIFKNYLENLHAYCQRHFFPPAWANINLSEALSRLYGLSGYVEQDRNSVKVGLAAGPSSAYREELETVVKKFNEEYVCDSQGRLVRLNLLHPRGATPGVGEVCEVE